MHSEDRWGTGSGISGRIRRITSGKFRWQQGLVATCKDSSNEGTAEEEENQMRIGE